jgi:hypothetical protein
MDTAPPKLLVVADTGLSPRLAEYALKVAVRLDLEIIVLFIDEKNSWENTRQHRSKVEDFETRVEQEAAAFTSLAWKSSVNVTTIVDVDQKETAITRIREQDQSIRFILTDADEKEGKSKTRQPQLTVIRTD